MLTNSTTLTTEEIGWLAGLLEGEGHFYISRRRHGTLDEQKRIYYSPRIKISMTDKDVIEKVTKLWGTKMYEYHRNDGVRRTYYETSLCGPNAIEFLLKIKVKMFSRRQEAINNILSHPGLSKSCLEVLSNDKV